MPTTEPETTGAAGGVVIRLLGPVEIDTATGPVRGSPTARLIIGCLAAHHPQAVGVGALVGLLHGDDGPSQRRAVRTAIWKLRSVLPPDVLITERDSYRLDPDLTSVDLPELFSLVEAVEEASRAKDDPEVRRLAARALSLWRGPLLGGDGPRVDADLTARVAELRHRAVEAWAGAALRQGVPGETLQLLRDLIAAEPLREGAWALLVESLSSLGQRTDVRTAVDGATSALAEVGLDPGPTLSDAISRAQGRVTARPAGRRGGPTLRWLARVAEGPFLGRAAEVDAVWRAVSGADAQTTRLVTVSGEPGVGKTRLVAEVARRAGEEGVVVWGGQCDPYHLQPFGSLLATLADAARRVDSVEVGRMMLGPLGALFGGRTATTLDAGSGPTAPPGATGTGSEQLDLFEAAADLLAAALGDQPGLLIVDDIHWAPRGALLMLRHLLTARSDLPLCLLVTARTFESATGPTRDLLAELTTGPGRQSVVLTGLEAAEIADHPDVAPDRPYGERLERAARLRRLSGGNPLLLGELLREGGESAVTGDGPLGPGLSGAIELHLASVGPTVRPVLAAAAVIGVEVDPQLLRQVLADRASTAEVHAALAAAEQAALLRHDSVRGTYSFCHEMLQAELLDRLSAIERAEIHAAVADALEPAMAGREDSPVLYDLASHLHRGLAAGTALRAWRWVQKAADRAVSQLDFGTAAGLYEQAAVAGAIAGVPGAAELVVQAGAAWRNAGDVEAARSCFGRAVIVARDRDDGPGLVLAAKALGGLALQVDGRVDEATRDLLAAADLSVAGGDSGVRLELRLLRLIGTSTPGGLARHLAVSDQGDPRALFDSVAAAYWTVPVEEHAGLAGLAGELAGRLDTPRDRALAGMIGWLCRIEAGQAGFDDPAAADIDADLARDMADGGDPEVAWMWATWGAVRQLSVGRFAQAEGAIDAAQRLGRRIPGSVGRVAQAVAVHRGQRCTLRFLSSETGGFDDEVRGIDRLWTLNPNMWDATVSLAHANAGRMDEARALFEPAAERLLDLEVVSGSPLAQLSTLTLTAEKLRDRPWSARLLERAQPWAGYRCLLNYAQYLGPVTMVIGILRQRLGDLDAAAESFASAAQEELEVGAEVMVVNARFRLLAVLVRRGRPADRAEIARLLEQVEKDAQRLGMPRVLTLLGVVA
jgi:DNA-binding SARP family transcriptional activator/tetratricopeptide (TPR) repeat protein